MPKNTSISSILVIGSGPIIIGQAAEFDYSGTQACQALKEEGYTVILVNSNPATIMTDPAVADKVYMEPLTVEFLTKIIARERPDALLPTLGGQTGLNLALKLKTEGVLDKYDVKLLGTSLESIEKGEDREKFRELMKKIGEPVPESRIVHRVDEAVQFAEEIGYPLIVRPAYTLGGTGGGICRNEKELREVTESGLNNSRVNQCLIERNISGWKEVEFEVIRDRKNQAIIVCDMENIDPVGIHTGDSIVVAPSQTLKREALELLKSASLKIVQALEIEGGCNVQLALDPESLNYYVIEVNPRVSRSSALASKATGYPIAKVTAKIAVGYTLDEINDTVTDKKNMYYEPELDYIVTKFPRFPFDKFTKADKRLGTQMKATGEVMAIGNSFAESFLKGIRSLEIGTTELWNEALEEMDEEEIVERLKQADHERIFVIGEAFRRRFTIDEVFRHTKIDRYFLSHIEELVRFEEKVKENKNSMKILRQAKKLGISDRQIARLWEITEDEVYEKRLSAGIVPGYKYADTKTSAGASQVPCCYSTYEAEKKPIHSGKKKVLVLGSGPIRIGQGIEFDYASVHSVLAIKEMGYEAIMINNNPETVSTDYSVADKLYFEPLTVEDVMHVVHLEQPEGVIVQFGGQTAINLAEGLEKRGVSILGTSLDSTDRAENRDRFETLLDELSILRPKGKGVFGIEEAERAAESIGFPVLVRPSYVIGGSNMEIVYTLEELRNYFHKLDETVQSNPILIDKYITGIEAEVDAISDGETTIIPGIMEHIERSGVHSGDSIAVYPPQQINVHQQQKIVEAAKKISETLRVKGLINIQFIIENEEVYVLEVNPRASRTIPFLSKITGVPMANLATKCILGRKLRDMGYSSGLLDEVGGVAVKVPVFSFAKLRSVDTFLGPEMKSTGEAIGYDRILEKALYKGLIASNIEVPDEGGVLVTVADKDKVEMLDIAAHFYRLGFDIYATEGTANVLHKHGIRAEKVDKVETEKPNVLSIIKEGKVQFVINTLNSGKKPRSDGFLIRRHAAEHGIPCLTNLDTAKAILKVIDSNVLHVQPITGKGAVKA
mgnify:FL=1